MHADSNSQSLWLVFVIYLLRQTILGGFATFYLISNLDIFLEHSVLINNKHRAILRYKIMFCFDNFVDVIPSQSSEDVNWTEYPAQD